MSLFHVILFPLICGQTKLKGTNFCKFGFFSPVIDYMSIKTNIQFPTTLICTNVVVWGDKFQERFYVKLANMAMAA